MPRKYDASRRAEQAKQTREVILEAAFRLHGKGILDYESLAADANVSLATVRKHFPNREALFEGCTMWAGQHVVPMPDFDLLARTNDPQSRLRLALSQMYAFYESMLGQLWLGHREVETSPVLQRQLGEIAQLRHQVVTVALEPWPASHSREVGGLTEGFFSFLTYFALRTDGSLSPEETTDRIGDVLIDVLQATNVLAGKEVAHS